MSESETDNQERRRSVGDTHSPSRLWQATHDGTLNRFNKADSAERAGGKTKRNRIEAHLQCRTLCGKPGRAIALRLGLIVHWLRVLIMRLSNTVRHGFQAKQQLACLLHPVGPCRIGS